MQISHYDPLKLPDLFLWGHNLNDYLQMFNFNIHDLKNKKIIELGMGAGTFNLEWLQESLPIIPSSHYEITQEKNHTQQDKLLNIENSIISYHPLYYYDKEELKSIIDKSFIQQTKNLTEKKDFFNIKNLDLLKNSRQENIINFFNDYAVGRTQNRYKYLGSTDLPYNHFEFDYALCSHFLFSYCFQNSVEFHFEIIKNLCDIAKEVRIFPLFSSDGKLPELLGPLMHKLHDALIGVEILAVPYEFQAQGNALLRLWSQSCDVKPL